MKALQIIASAIMDKKILIFTYENCEREVAPHHYGILNGKLQLHAYQLSGESNSERPVGWKNFVINKIKKLSLTQKSFRPRNDHHPENSNYTSIEKTFR